ncbi:MAG: alpha-amylase [Cyclobacteriaceae bacterium]|nr:alpha-amylase [Cyclobacteriaceae bacterium]
MKPKLILAILLFASLSCTNKSAQDQSEATNPSGESSFQWANANVYFLLTDRFANGDITNDFAYDRKRDGAKFRSYEGGDIRGIIQKLDAGYFDSLGISAIWTTPVFENIHGAVDEGSGKTYAYHGYWPIDWTNIDANLGTLADYKELIDKAHAHGIRVLMDVIINHTGPHTDMDNAWPDSWVRQGPPCTHVNYETNVDCALAGHLPDIRTDSDEPVELPPFLLDKWKEEGRLDQELAELDAFFERTGYPRAPRFYLIKWITDYVRDLGIDGFRVDTAKHTEAYVWDELFKEAQLAFEEWKKNNPDAVLDETPFYMVGEVYGFSIYSGESYNYGDTAVNFYDNGFQSLINFSFKDDAKKQPEELFSQYSDALNGVLAGKELLNYLDSHDDGSPYDRMREKPFEAGTKLLLSPGTAQVYYGDETARPLQFEDIGHDADLRSFMNWEDLKDNTSKNGYTTSDVFAHYAKLGRFRRAHPAVGAGVHKKLLDAPYTFSRTLDDDKVVVVLDKTEEPIDVSSVFGDGTVLTDYYSGTKATVQDGKVSFDSSFEILLIGK